MIFKLDFTRLQKINSSNNRCRYLCHNSKISDLLIYVLTTATGADAAISDVTCSNTHTHVVLHVIYISTIRKPVMSAVAVEHTVRQ